MAFQDIPAKTKLRSVMTGRQFKAFMGFAGNGWVTTYCSVKPGQSRPALDFHDLSIPGVVDNGGIVISCNDRLLEVLRAKGGDALVQRVQRYFTFVKD